MRTAVLFDLDLTLVDYEPAVPGIFAATCASLDLPTDETTLPRFGDRFAARFKRAELDAMYAPEGVREGVAAVAAAHPVGVVTNGYGPVQRRKLDRAGLSRFADVVVTPTEVGVAKPDPGLLRTGARALPADRYVAVGDSVEGDLDPARELGFECVLVGDTDDRALACLDGPGALSRLPGVLD